MGKIDVQETKEENRLIVAVAELLIYICKDNKELAELEEEMKTSAYNLIKIHPEYCKKKAAVVESFLASLQGDNNNERH